MFLMGQISWSRGPCWDIHQWLASPPACPPPPQIPALAATDSTRAGGAVPSPHLGGTRASGTCQQRLFWREGQLLELCLGRGEISLGLLSQRRRHTTWVTAKVDADRPWHHQLTLAQESAEGNKMSTCVEQTGPHPALLPGDCGNLGKAPNQSLSFLTCNMG